MTLREYVLAARRAFAAEDALRALQDTATPAVVRDTIREYVIAHTQLEAMTAQLALRRGPNPWVVPDAPDTGP